VEILILVAIAIGIALFMAHRAKTKDDKPTLPTEVTDYRPIVTGGGSPVEPVQIVNPIPNPSYDDAVIRAMMGSLTPEQLASRTSGSSDGNNAVSRVLDWHNTGVWARIEGPSDVARTVSITPDKGWKGLIEVFISQVPSGLGSVSRVKFSVVGSLGVIIASDGWQNSAGTGCRFTHDDSPCTLVLTFESPGALSVNVLHTP